MKTVEQVKNWLEYQGIYNKVVKNLMNAHSDNKRINSFEGAVKILGEDLILHGFIWENTPEGGEFWNNINNIFKVFWNSPKDLIAKRKLTTTILWRRKGFPTKEEVLKLFPEAFNVVEKDSYFDIQEIIPTLQEL